MLLLTLTCLLSGRAETSMSSATKMPDMQAHTGCIYVQKQFATFILVDVCIFPTVCLMYIDTVEYLFHVDW